MSVLTVDDSFVRDIPELSTPWEPQQAPQPELLVVSEGVAAELGIPLEELTSATGIAELVGNARPDGSAPVAMAYAGHQFGGYSPRLGDGRAVLLGEVTDSRGQRVDLHLKGSGRTPYARGGDGNATVSAMLREFLFAEAIHALGIPTTRALAVVATGGSVIRDGPEPGAVLVRAASSHLRVGTFEYAARLSEDRDVLRRLADYAIERHYPELADREDRYLGLLEAVVNAQAELVASWMLVGFVHGVMNTDNVTISGETIDYGPCAFMDRFDPKTVFSSIDHQGRYAFGNQPAVTHWNLTRFAETLVPLIDEDVDVSVPKATEVLNGFAPRFQTVWLNGMRTKLGLEPSDDTKVRDEQLVDEFLELLHEQRVDFTTGFRALAASLRGDDQALDVFGNGEACSAWTEKWLKAIGSAEDTADAMDQVNPIYLLRNHLVEAALSAATEGDMAPFNRLREATADPFARRDGFEDYATPAPDEFTDRHQTFCGT